ncbi:response regulator [Rhodopirellula sp. MGV]|uniref:response regulator n=1 Tax=Rhodopirellula sp. MGV TaxID=2023130 RepID=UPI000B9787B4|nr:response regulator [Rhodopirellula sp. MGV]OYP36317.1 response regulator [Rhodopirellula sp. MGV]PNY38449.1 response regulator [Rhodopirellula baltica]
MKSLVIDDSRAMRRILRSIMSDLGFDVIEAGDGKDGLEKFTAERDDIEVVLVDWNMPVMNGLEFVKAVRELEQFADKKLVMVTTETEPAQMARALMAGVDEFVMKPFTKEILVEKLKLIGVGLNTSEV